MLFPTMANILSVAGSNSKYKQPGAQAAGFLGGLWHGFIAPITFIVSLFGDGVSIYETHNNGRWYEFGFIVGICAHAGDNRASHAVGG
jgi:amino acid transporter